MSNKPIDIELRNPDIRHLVEMAKKYKPLMEGNDDEIKILYNHWDTNVFQRFIPIAASSQTTMFKTEEEITKFTYMNRTTAWISLYTAWAIGREFIETYPDQAKFCLLIKTYESQFLPEITKNELIDVSDFAAFLILRMLQKLYELDEFDEKTLINGIEINQKIFRGGVLNSFKSGIASLYNKG